MSSPGTPFSRYAVRVAALLVMGLAYLGARLPDLGDEERAALASRFAFERFEVASWQGEPFRSTREVNPSLERHSGWISAVGAAIALADLDGDGLANDVCHVDPRNDRVTLSPSPDRPERYPLRLLAAPAGWVDRSTMAPMSCLPSDLNEDGWMDLLVTYWGRPPLAFLRRPSTAWPPGPDAFRVQEIVAGGERWYTNAAVFADLDGDGHLDLLIGNYFQDGARILDATTDQVDRMQHSMTRAYNGGRNRVLRWAGATSGGEPSVRFEEVEGVFARDELHAWTLAIGAADLDGDLLPELYFANDFGPDRLYHNRSGPEGLRFALAEAERGLFTPRSKVLGRDGFKGMGVDFADVDGDARLDLFVSNIAAEYALEESHFLFVSEGDLGDLARGIAPFVDRSESLGLSRSDWSWDTRFGDFDNDGGVEALQATGFLSGDVDRWPELQELATGNDELLQLPGSWPRFQAGDDLSGHAHNPFYARGPDGRFHDLARELGIASPEVSRGIATADVDGDGDLDFAVANQWAPSFLYRNDAGAPDESLVLRLLLPTADPERGRPAVGASVRVEGPGERVQVAQVDGGNGHSGVRSPELHFGLGPDAGPVRVEIHYRDSEGRPGVVEQRLAPGRHSVWLPEPPLLRSAALERNP